MGGCMAACGFEIRLGEGWAYAEFQIFSKDIKKGAIARALTSAI